jgi:hypothetical protein
MSAVVDSADQAVLSGRSLCVLLLSVLNDDKVGVTVHRWLEEHLETLWLIQL